MKSKFSGIWSCLGRATLVRVGTLLTVTLGLLMCVPTGAKAQFVVTSTNDTGAGSLRAAITVADAAPGSTITFSLAPNSTITLASDLPAITTSTTINGAGAPGLTLNGNNASRGFFVYSGTVAISNINIANTLAQGGTGGLGGGGAGMGGGLFVSSGAHVTVTNVAFQSATAAGGNTTGIISIGGGGLGGSTGGNNAGSGGGGVGNQANGGTGLPGNGSPGIIPGAAPGGNGAAGGTGGANGGGGGGTFSGGGGGGGVGGAAASGNSGGAGGFGGGGGGGAAGPGDGGAGGFGGGGGGSRDVVAGAGGYGGGGGGSYFATASAGGFGAGNGTTTTATLYGIGGGGAGMGGAIFVMQGGSLAVAGTLTVNGNSVTGGTSDVGGNGQAFGSGFFMQGSGTLNFTPGAGQTQTNADVIADEAGVVAAGYTPPAGFGALGSWGLTVSGGGTLALSGANIYAGSTTIVSGTTLALSGGGSISNSSVVNANGTFDISGSSFAFNPITSLAGSGTVLLGGNGLAITGGFTEFSGAINGTGGLEIFGGTQTLSGVNAYSGVTQINSGATLALKAGGSIANSFFVRFRAIAGGVATFDISQTNNGATVAGLLDLTGVGVVSLGSKTLTLNNNVAPFKGVLQDGGIGGGTGGNLTIANGGLATFAGVNTYTGLTTINSGGELDLVGNGSIAHSKAVINNGIFDISVLSGGASIAGLSGTSTGVVNLGPNTLTFTNANGTFAGVIQDGGAGGSVAMTGGKEILTGTSTYTGATTISGGTLEVDGSIANTSGVTVNSGGTLSGTGIVDPVTTTIMSGGTLAPGNASSPTGILAITGNLAFQSGAVYLVQVTPSAAARTNVSGTAALAGTVQAVFAPGTYLSKQYDILHSAGLGGTNFSGLTSANAPAGFNASLSYSATDVFLNLSALLGSGTPLNQNQQSVANAINGFFNNGGSLPPAFQALFGLSGSNLGNALTQASGESATGSQQTTFNAMGQFLGLLTDPFMGRGNGVGGASATPYAEESANSYAARRRDDAFAMFTKAPPAPFVARWSVWAAGFGGSQSTNGNALVGSNDTSSSIFGTAVGADYLFSPDTLAGFALAGGGTNFSVNNLGSGRSDLFQAGAYVRHTAGNAYITGALAYGWQDITTNRTVTIAGLDQLRAEFNANAYSGRLEGGYRFVTPWIGGVGITPYAAGQFTTFDLPAYAEQALTGTNTFALAYGSKSVTDTRSELGIRTDKSFAVQDGILTLRGRLAWAHDFDPDRNIAATFQALPGASFVVGGAAQAHESALTTASAEMKWMNGWSAAATFEGEFSNVTRSYAGKGTVRYIW
jgi:autotransporter-associated beta strand protein